MRGSVVADRCLGSVAGIARDHGAHGRREVRQVYTGCHGAIGRRVETEREVRRGPEPAQYGNDLVERARVRWNEREIDLIRQRSASYHQVGGSRGQVVGDLHVEVLVERLPAKWLEQRPDPDRISGTDSSVLRRLQRRLHQLGYAKAVVVMERDLDALNVRIAELIRDQVLRDEGKVRGNRLPCLRSRPTFTELDGL